MRFVSSRDGLSRPISWENPVGGSSLIRGLAAIIVGCLALPACTTDPGAAPIASVEEAITNGAPDLADTAVVALAYGGPPSCTGVVVDARVVLTAAHCLDTSGRLPEVAFGARSIPVLRARVHPAYDRETRALDLALLLRGAPVTSDVEPVPLNETPFDPSFVGRSIRVAGFGIPASARPSGGKQTGQSLLVDYTDTTFLAHPAPSQPCRGDSGGPAFLTLDGVERLVGITSFGDADCAAFARFTRVDATLDTFIQPFIDEAREGATTAPGGCRLAPPPRERGCARLAAVLIACAVVVMLRRRRSRGEARVHHERVAPTCTSQTGSLSLTRSGMYVASSGSRGPWSGSR
ncbi:hypothetical protein BH11MYX4_BH11MYX4_13220 [soil metagenome]